MRDSILTRWPAATVAFCRVLRPHRKLLKLVFLWMCIGSSLLWIANQNSGGGSSDSSALSDIDESLASNLGNLFGPRDPWSWQNQHGGLKSGHKVAPDPTVKGSNADSSSSSSSISSSISSNSNSISSNSNSISSSSSTTPAGGPAGMTSHPDISQHRHYINITIPSGGEGGKSEEEYLAEVQKQLPNLPISFLYENRKRPMHLANNKSCGKLPNIYDIHFSNSYWQETTTSNGTFYLYAAYLDVRPANRLGPSVRILTMLDRIEPNIAMHCLLWFPNSTVPVVSKVLEYKYIWDKHWGNYHQGLIQPYLITCQLPKARWKDVPSSVSVVEKICNAQVTNSLKVIYNRPEMEPDLDGNVSNSSSKNSNEDKVDRRREVAVCVKGLDFPDMDISVKLVEWVELLRLLGADKIFMYRLEVHPRTQRVLDHYVEQGVIDLTPHSLPGYLPNLKVLQHFYLKLKVSSKRQNELIPYNDCLYRNIYRYKHVALLDIDEVIMPKAYPDWKTMLAKLRETTVVEKAKNKVLASFNFRNVYFMESMLNARLHPAAATNNSSAANDTVVKAAGEEAAAMAVAVARELKDIPGFMHMLRHVYRSSIYTKPGFYVKCFHDTARVLTLHNHFPLSCLGGACVTHSVKPEDAHLQHYRKGCVKDLKNCTHYESNVAKDTTIWRFKDDLIENSVKAFGDLGFIL